MVVTISTDQESWEEAGFLPDPDLVPPFLPKDRPLTP